MLLDEVISIAKGFLPLTSHPVEVLLGLGQLEGQVSHHGLGGCKLLVLGSNGSCTALG